MRSICSVACMISMRMFMMTKVLTLHQQSFMLSFFILKYFYLLSQLKRALELRPIIDELANADHKLYLSAEEWSKIEEITKILLHPYQVTLLLQKVNYTMSDFFAAWHQLKLLFASLATKNRLAERLLTSMNDPKHHRLLTNPLILCSVFLDPRTKGIILKSRENSFIAKISLVQLWDRVTLFEKENSSGIATDDNDDATAEIPLDFNFDLFEKFSNSDDSLNTANTDKPDIMNMLNAFELEKSEPMGKSIFAYWEEKKDVFPELYKLAKVVHAAPPSQTSCERTFSTVSFVFNKYRSRLSEETLQNTLLLKLNKDFFDDVLAEEIQKKKDKNNEV